MIENFIEYMWYLLTTPLKKLKKALNKWYIPVSYTHLVAAFVVLWNKSEAFRGFWIGLFEQVKSSFMQAWQTLKPALQNLGQKFMELYQAVQPILEVLGAVLGLSLIHI